MPRSGPSAPVGESFVRYILPVLLVGAGFAALHSLCVTETVKNLMVRMFGEHFVRGAYRFVFTCFSVLTLIVCMALIREIPDRTIVTLPAPVRAVFHIVQLIGLAVGAVSFRVINFAEFIGITQLVTYMREGKVPGDIEGIRDNRLIVRGVYRYVRHPLYLAGILIFTFNPYLTVNWLTVSVLADLYFIYGALIEERRMLNRFGDEYRDYMKRVPRFIPELKGS